MENNNKPNIKKLSKIGGLYLLTAYIMSLTDLEEDFAEDIAYAIFDDIDEQILTKANRYKEPEEKNEDLDNDEYFEEENLWRR